MIPCLGWRMRHSFVSLFMLCLLAVLSCSNGEQDDMIIEPVVKQDTIIVDKKDTLSVDGDTIVVDKKDTIIIEKDFIVLKEDNSLDFHIERVEYWMKQPRGMRGKQGADAYNGLLFQFQVGHSVLDILDVKSKEIITTVEMDYDSNYHCNNADFGNTFYDADDEIPLFYSSQQGRYAQCIVVDRITKQNGNYKLQTVQRIDLPREKEIPLQYTPDAVIDKKNGFIYVYAGNTIPITDFYIYKFRLPEIVEGEVVQLRREEIISKWMISGNPAFYKQGGAIIGHFLITLEGMSNNKIRVIDLENNRYKLIDMTADYGAKWEPEDIFIVDGELFVASGGTGIYKIVLSDNKVIDGGAE